MGFGRWYGRQRASVQAALVSAVILGTLGGVFGIIDTELTKTAAGPPVLPPSPTLTASAVPSVTLSGGGGPCSPGLTPAASNGGELDQPDAIADDGTHIWVANLASSTVTELNASDGSPVQVLRGGAYGFDHPRAIAVGGQHVWVANTYSSTVTELNAGDGRVVQVIKGSFAGPNAIAVSGNVVWVSNDGGSVTELNAQTGQLIQQPIGDSSYRFDQPDAIVADGPHVWVANFCSSTVTELNASDGTLVQVLSDGKYMFDHPRAIAVVDSHVFVANSHSSTVTELNASNGSFVQVIPQVYFAGPDAIAVSARNVWITNDGADGGASVTELDAQTGQPVQQPIGDTSYQFDQPWAIAVDSAHGWITNEASSTVTEINLGDGGLVQVLPKENLTAAITYPANQASISTPQTVHAVGTVQHLRQGDHLLLFGQWDNQPRYWAGDLDVAVSGNGSWTGTACFGFPGRVKIWLVALTPDGLNAVEHAPLNDWQNGFTTRPDEFAPGIQMIASTTIIAGQGGPGCQQNLRQLY